MRSRRPLRTDGAVSFGTRVTCSASMAVTVLRQKFTTTTFGVICPTAGRLRGAGQLRTGQRASRADQEAWYIPRKNLVIGARTKERAAEHILSHVPA